MTGRELRMALKNEPDLIEHILTQSEVAIAMNTKNKKLHEYYSSVSGPSIKTWLCINPNVSNEILLRFLNDPDPGVQSMAQQQLSRRKHK